MIHIRSLIEELEEEERDEWQDELRRADIDSRRCPICGRLLEERRESYEAWGNSFTIPVLMCPECD